MATRRPKKPSSARRNISQETFSPYVSLNRLRRVQSLLRGGCRASTQAPDAVLCILGIDGRYNDGCRQLADYLLFDFFKLRRVEIERLSYPEETIDDLIFMIGRHRVDVYCNPVNYLFMLPYISHWQNLRIHCMTEEEYEEDEEEAEEFKIQSFISMTDGYSSVGIPYSRSNQSETFDKMSVEKWPIVQAYALEGFHGGGFFTMNHEVVDLSSDLAAMYHLMDPVSVEALVTQQLPLFEKQWTGMLANLDMAGDEGIPSLSEDKVGEPIHSFFKHGQVRSTKNLDSSVKPVKHPFVLFGTNSCRNVLEAMDKTGAISAATLKTTGVGEDLALHMVCQAVSPRGPLSCLRTYFFQAGGTPYPMSSDAVTDDKEYSDVRVLIELYLACVDAVLSAIKVYSQTLNINQARRAAEDAVHACCRKLNLPRITEHFKNSNSLKFSIEAYDNNNRKVSLSESSNSLYVKSCGLVWYDVPSQHAPNTSLGSVAFSEAFINSSLKTAKPDGSVGLDGEATVLTAAVPRFINWTTGQREVAHQAEVLKCLASGSHATLGQRLMEGQTASLLIERTRESLDTGVVYFYQQGVIYTQAGHVTLVVPKSEMTSLSFYDGDSPSVVALVVMSFKPSFSQFVPPVLQSQRNTLILALHPKTKAYRAFFTQVLTTWREDQNSVPLQAMKELSDSLLELHQFAQAKYESSSSTAASPLKHHVDKLPGLQKFLMHFSVGSASSSPVPAEDLRAVLNQGKDSDVVTSTPQVAVTVVAGVPGGGQMHLVETLTKLGKEYRWEVIEEPADLCKGFDPAPLHKRLTHLVSELQQAPRDIAQMFRVVIVFSGFTDLVHLIQALSAFPDKSLQQHITIGAVTVCLDPRNTFMAHRYTLPGLLDQCSQGWVNNIIFTGSSNQLDARHEELQQLVRAANSDVALINAPGGEVTRSPDIQLILSSTAFNAHSMIRARHLNRPGWWNSTSTRTATVMDNVAIQFSQPLIKLKLLAKLNGLKASHKPYPFEGNIYHIQGRIQLEDNPDIYQLSYTPLSRHLSLERSDACQASNPHSPGSPFFLVFMGCRLMESGLKDWLRGCARQRPEKKALKTRDTLSSLEVKKIHSKHHLDHLPEGWYFNGSQYLSLDGAKSSFHPCLDQFLDEYLQEVNEEVQKFNNSVDAMVVPDLFD